MKAIFKIVFSTLLLAAVLFLAPSGAKAQLSKGGPPTSGSGHGHGGGHSGSSYGPFIGATPTIVSASPIPLGIVIELLVAASQEWSIPFGELFLAYQTGDLTIDEIAPGVYRVRYGGETLDLILEDL